MTRPKHIPGLASSDDLQRVIDRLCAVLEDELGDNLGAWGAVSMVLLSIICDMAQADIHQIADALRKGDKGFLQ